MDNLTSGNLSLYEQSLLYLNLQLYWNIVVYFCICPLTLTSNIVVALVLYKGRNVLNSHHYKLLLHTSIVTTLLAIDGITLLGLKKLVQTLSNISDVMERWVCSMYFVSFEYFMIADAFNVVVVSVDRFLAASFPMWYRNVNLMNSYKRLTLLFPHIGAVSMLTIQYSLYTSDFAHSILVICLTPNTYPPIYSTLFSAVSAVVCLCTLSFYASAVILVLYKTCKDKNNAKKLKKDMGFRLIVTSSTDAAVYVCSFVISICFIIAVVSRAPVPTQITIGPVALGLYMLSDSPRLIIMYVLNRDFRSCFQSIFMKTKVMTISRTNGSQRTPVR